MIRIRQIKVPVEKDSLTYLQTKVLRQLNIDASDIKNISINKKSLDARHKPQLFYIYEVDVETNNDILILKKHQTNKDILSAPTETYLYPKLGNTSLKTRPIIVGSGPAGLFCAYLLAELNYQPHIIERGEPVEERIKTVEEFWDTGKLNINSNVQFGEGGAGTFSDGKLNTLVKDKNHRMKKVFEIFVECGADPEILYTQNPHIGTDVLRDVVKNMRNKIIQMGGTFSYNTCLTNIITENNTIKAIEVNHQKLIPTDLLILAIGHSARDTFTMLYQHSLTLEPKPFALGLRIQHPQKMINQNQYGPNYPKNLPPASYKLTYKASNNRGVYSFCMCPGGYVVNASSEPGRLAINGMSYHNRDSQNANSAIVVTVSPEDYGNDPLAGMNYQRDLETKAYNLGNGQIPIQTLKDFHNNLKTLSLGNIKPIFKGNYSYANLNQLFPQPITTALKEALIHFDTKIKGFNQDDALIAGIETRTSSPLRIPRGEDFQSLDIKGLYPCGEGAGYAGGITTSAMDGLKVAEAIITRYQSFN